VQEAIFSFATTVVPKQQRDEQVRKKQKGRQNLNVLVAGAIGYLGRCVVREFKRRGHWIRALARNPERLAEPGLFLAPAVRDQIDDLFVGEVTLPETLADF
jgi:nucleoside-diphosphate-sugar epimerase